jgi:branched-chain amino acid transport system substrate-binding protein
MAQPFGSAPRVLLALVSVGLLVLAASASVGVSAPTRAAADGSLECKNGAITVGIAKAKSGVASFFDIAGTRGTKIAIDQINAAGGIKGCKIKTIEGDTKSDPAVAAQVARSLLDKGAQILLVPDDFDLGIAAARVGQKAGVLTLSLAASSTEFAKAVGDKFFNSGPTTTQLANAQAQFALQRGWKRAYMVLDPGLAYFTEQDTVFRKKFQAGGGKMVGTDKVDSLSGKSDYSSTVSKIKSLNPAPTVINAQMIFSPIGSFVKQLRAAGINTPVIGNVTLQTRELPKLVGKAGSHDVYFSAQVYFEGANQDPKSDRAVERTGRLPVLLGDQQGPPAEERRRRCIGGEGDPSAEEGQGAGRRARALASRSRNLEHHHRRVEQEGSVPPVRRDQGEVNANGQFSPAGPTAGGEGLIAGCLDC